MRRAVVSLCVYGVGLVLIVVSAGVAAFAAPVAVSAPEIDGGSIASGLGLVTGAVLILRSRRRTK
jgi:hypothetical protein